MSGLQNNNFQTCVKDASSGDYRRYEDAQSTPNLFKQTSKKNTPVEEFNYKTKSTKDEYNTNINNNNYYGLNEGMLTFGKNPLHAAIAEYPKDPYIENSILNPESSIKKTASFKRQKNQSNKSNNMSDNQSKIVEDPSPNFNQTPSFNKMGRVDKTNSPFPEKNDFNEKLAKEDE